MDPDRLSTIDEEPDDDYENELFFDIDQETNDVYATIADRTTDERVVVEGLYHYYESNATMEHIYEPDDVDENGNAYVEMLSPDEHAKLIVNEQS